MKHTTEDYTYKSITELTDTELEAFGDYIYKNDSLLYTITGDIYDDVKTYCENGLRSMGYAFECDGMIFDSYNNFEDFVNLEYVNKLPYDEDVNDNVSIGVSELELSDIKFVDIDEIVNSIIFSIYAEKEDIIYDNDTFDFIYFKQNNSKDFKTYYELTDSEFDAVSKYIYDFVEKIKSEYNVFKDAADTIINWYEDVIRLYGPKFNEHITNCYFDLGIYFDEDGDIIDYDWNYEE